MKKYIIFSFLIFILVSCGPKVKSITVTIENSSAIDRTEEIVEVDFQQLSKVQTFEINKIVVFDNNNQEVPYQIIYAGNETPQLLIFPASVSANSTVSYTISEGTPSEFPRRTFGRQVPERKDDFAWENDRVVYRAYGPALANENPSNGYDMWLKKTDKMIIDQFYKDDLENNKSYHVDHGEGLDCYKVAHTLGAGAIAPFGDEKIWVQNHYSTAKILDSGILRTTFELTYQSVPFKEVTLDEKLIITLDAGSQFNKAVVTYSGNPDKMDLAAGMILHDGTGSLIKNQEKRFLSYSEEVTSDAGVPAGRSHIGIIFADPVQSFFQDEVHAAGVVTYTPGNELTYYFGSGWNQWGFETDEKWLEEVEVYISKINSPLKLSIQE